jgi:hypothetical protein
MSAFYLFKQVTGNLITQAVSPDFLTECEDVITEREPDLEENPSEAAPDE